MTALADEFGKVAVLMGGWSAEREISLLSGNAVMQALGKNEIDAHAIDVDHSITGVLGSGDFDRAFVMLHGRGGEDGVMQGLLEILELPYTGSNVLGSAVAMDKLRSKQIWESLGIPTPEYVVLSCEEDCEQVIGKLGLPFIVKPVLEGSSIGMTKVEHTDQAINAYQLAKECQGVVMAERWIEGNEYTAAILNGRVLPIIKLETPRDFYDYDAKYTTGDTQYIYPCDLGDREKELEDLMSESFDAVGASGWGRVDFMVDEEQQPWLIEVNTVPGMTNHSLVPMAAKHAGIEFKELVLEILRTCNGN